MYLCCIPILKDLFICLESAVKVQVIARFRVKFRMNFASLAYVIFEARSTETLQNIPNIGMQFLIIHINQITRKSSSDNGVSCELRKLIFVKNEEIA